MKKLLLSFLHIITFSSIVFHSFGQTPTIGLRFHDDLVTEGYTLFTPEKNTNVYLINDCGEKVNEWNFTDRPSLTAYILENGNILRAGKSLVEIRDWDDNVIWSYAVIDQHHDIEPLPNGNILCLLWDRYSDTEMIAMGRNPATVGMEMRLDKIIEIQPVGTNGANVVWEWKFADHFIQDFDNTKPNFGIVTDHPELLDLNFVDANVPNQDTDYTHANGLDYNEALDQIIISVRHLNEIYIIDHSTTTSEAASHTGGNSNMGGDFLWRWGNPQVYGQGDDTNQKLFLQHDSKWIESGYLDGDKISVFNNGGVDGAFTSSSAHIITPEIVNGTYTKENNMFKPLDYEWTWSGSILGATMFEGKKSGAHGLPNGNFIIAENHIGQVTEVNKGGTVLWTYKNPTSTGTNVYDQFETPGTDNSFFRAEKYPSDYIGFTGKDLTPQTIIENENAVSDLCIMNALNIETFDFTNLIVTNPVEGGLISFNGNLELDTIRVLDINGRILFEQNGFNANEVQLNLKPALYFLMLEKGNTKECRKIIAK